MPRIQQLRGSEIETHGRFLPLSKDHSVTTQQRPLVVIVSAKTSAAPILASAAEVLALNEQHSVQETPGGVIRYHEVLYFDRDCVNMALLHKTSRITYCAFKGYATYYEHDGVEVAWSYEQPYEQLLCLKNRLAFYADRVAASTLDPAV